MLSKTIKGLFVEFNEFSILAAVTSGLVPPFRIEFLKEFPYAKDRARNTERLDELFGPRGRTYIPAHISCYPQSRFVRRFSLDQPAKAKDPAFFVDMLNNQFRIDPEKNTVAVINAVDGMIFDPSKSLQNQKELLICGGPNEELEALQEEFVGYGIFPERLEIGTLTSLGGLMNYVRSAQMKQPTMVVEISSDASNLFIFGDDQLDITRPIPYGLNSMFPLIQQELGLKDEESARKLFHSNTFDFTEMGPTLLRRMLKELSASTGFYEVQTGQTIGQIFLTMLPRNLGWIQSVLARNIGVKVLSLDYASWLKEQSITASDSVQLETLDNRWLGVFSLMGNLTASKNVQAKK